MEKRHLLSTEKHSGDEDAYFFMIENMFAIGRNLNICLEWFGY